MYGEGGGGGGGGIIHYPSVLRRLNLSNPHILVHIRLEMDKRFLFTGMVRYVVHGRFHFLRLHVVSIYHYEYNSKKNAGNDNICQARE